VKGLRQRDIAIGTGPAAQSGCWATVRYDCYLPQGDRCGVGSVFLQAGKDRNTFPALAAGVVGMHAGGIRELKVSPQLAYRERSSNPAIPESAALRYEVTLIEVWNEAGNEKL
jgi:FKBP-type peptidyl-prolyl cis-trans isomerase